MAIGWNDSTSDSDSLVSPAAVTRRRIEADQLSLFHRGAITLGAALVAMGLALLPIPFGAETLVFTCAIAYLVPALWFGPLWGILAAVPAASTMWIQYGAATPSLLAVLEAFCIGLLFRFGLRPLFAGTLFWMVAAIVLFIALDQGFALHGEWVTAAVLPLVGMIGVMAAEVIMHGARRALRLSSPNLHQPIGLTLRYWVTFVTVLPLLLIVLIEGREQLTDAEDQAKISLRHKAETLRLLLDNYVDTHLDVLRLEAGQTRPYETWDEAQMSEQLRGLWHNYPGFISLLIADHEGVIAAAAFADDIGEDIAFAKSSQSVADRSYFTEAKRSGLPFVSNVFRGRGFGNDIISAISVPLTDRNGDFLGIIEGSLNLARFDQLYQLAELDERHEFIIIDGDSKILFYDADSEFRPLQQYFAQDDGNKLTATENLYSAPWTAITKQTYRTAIAPAAGYFVALMWMIPIAMLLARMIAGQLARRFSAPLETIVEQLRARIGLVHSHQFDQLLFPAEGYQEAEEAVQGINALLRTLGRSYDDLEQTIAERDRLNESLNETLNHMDTLVRQRTSDLADALRSAKSANEAKNIFLAKTSHEIRTPMHAIIGINELLRNSNLDSQQSHYTHVIGDAAESLLALIDEILDFSKIETGQLDIRPEALKIQQLLENATALLRERAHNKGLQLSLEIDALPDWILLDAVRARQVLLNLITNAIKFTEQGEIKVSASIVGKKPSQRLRLTVTDTGIGIPVDRLGDVFEPFLQLGDLDAMANRGSGLGLSISKRVVELSGGQIGVDSMVGKGSTFWVEWPLEIPAEIPVEARTESRPEIKTDGAPLLVVDDNSVNRQMLIHQLNYLGLEAEEAAGGISAVAYVERHQPEIVWLDCQMPRVDGFETARRLRKLELDQQPYIIAITAQTSDEARQRCIDAGMNDFVSKPAKLDAIRAAIQRAQGNRSVISELTKPRVDSPADSLDRSVIDNWMEIEQAGDKPVVDEMLVSIQSQLDQILPRIREHIDTGAFAAAKADAHQLKGSTATVGASRMAKLMKQLEQACERNSMTEAKNLLHAAVAERLQLATAIDEVLNRTDVRARLVSDGPQ